MHTGAFVMVDAGGRSQGRGCSCSSSASRVVALPACLPACSVVAQVRALLQQLDGPSWQAAQEQLEDIFALKEETVSWHACLHACVCGCACALVL